MLATRRYLMRRLWRDVLRDHPIVSSSQQSLDSAWNVRHNPLRKLAYEETAMPEHETRGEGATAFSSQQRVFANLERILGNQEKVDKVLSNQMLILANQERILKNQEKLDTILSNQSRIIANQEQRIIVTLDNVLIAQERAGKH
jgi:hypothetical protein